MARFVRVARSVRAASGDDADSLHGLLCLVEQGIPVATLVTLSRINALPAILDDARAGRAGRVPPAHADDRGSPESGDGLIPRLWKRAVIALMLRPGGAVSDEITKACDEFGHYRQAGTAVSDVREDLKVLRVSIEAVPISGSAAYRYSITGRSAWRLQKIIDNGWSL